MAALAADPKDGQGWDGFVRFLIGTACLLFGLGVLFLLVVDPYGSGQTGLPGRPGVQDQYPMTAHASRARNPAFNAAVFGNSRVQQLNPERLNRLTGLSFVSLTMPGTGPADQIAVLRWFLANHETPPKAVVIGADGYWCRPTFAFSDRFPAWLYDRRFLAYLGGVVRYRSLEAAASRIGFLWSGKGGARPDGYWDYVPIFAGLGLADPEASRQRVEGNSKPSFEPNPRAAYPAIDALRDLLRTVPKETRFVLVRPPVYRNGLPAPGTAGAANQAACNAQLAAVAAEFPQVRLIDFMTRGPVADAASNFYDFDHYRDPIAAEVEREIATTLGRS